MEKNLLVARGNNTTTPQDWHTQPFFCFGEFAARESAHKIAVLQDLKRYSALLDDSKRYLFRL
jgi:hypothetical protein